MDFTTLVSAAISLLGVATGIYIARSTRRKNEGDAALAITQAAEKVVLLREKDMERLAALERYVDYLHDWIGEHVDGPAHPKSFNEFRRDEEAK